MQKLQDIWNSVQDFFDISGDVWIGLFTAFILWRLAAVLKGAAPLNCSEAAAYSTAVAAFAYSNHGPKL